MKSGKLRYWIVWMCSCLALILAGCGGGSAEGDDEKNALRFATGGTSGTYYSYGEALSKVLGEHIDGLSTAVLSTGGSKENILLLSKGEADMALVQNDVMSYAMNGTDLFEEEGVTMGYYAAAALYSEVIQIVAVPEIASIEDLKGKRVSVGAVGSGVEVNARQILDAYGIGFDDIELNNLSFADSAEAIEKGELDAAFVTAGPPTTAVTELSEKTDIRLLPIDDTHRDILRDKYAFYAKYLIPAGMYNGIDENVPTVTVKATLILSDKISDEMAYDIVKCIFENKEEIIKAHDKGTELDPDYAVDGVSIPMHLGAQNYFKEIGVL